jgi:hypothetical protein
MRISTACRVILGATTLSLTLAPAVVHAAAATPPTTGCPPAWELLSLDTLEGQGYVFAPDLDANGDRLVCGKPLNAVVQARICLTFPGGDCPVPVIYALRDNDVAQR